ncbi:hypothetical protein [Lyngbya sp. CCY1209]|uniref:hypothetical protein n=1 Tax=Lyngbya sp. CCY1209 TaxID=2886103 RepID=UPI002D1FDB91|nr:hypothetical protein [Lyngbya sp. CCY1209]MEB3885654.1 hypothetical protein [Lyngbya sp. CCY1209]
MSSMANYNPDTSGLKQPKWDHTPTRAIRVPAEFADELLAIARRMDRGVWKCRGAIGVMVGVIAPMVGAVSV